MSTNTGKHRYIGHGISVIDYPATVLKNAKYRLDENNNNIGEIIDYASTEQIPDKDASIAQTWNGREKRYVTTFKVALENGSERWLNSVDYTPSRSFKLPDKDNPEQYYVAVSLGYSKHNDTPDFDSDFTVVTNNFVCHPSAVVEAAPVTNDAASTGY
jgi:hypothetical protein